MTSAKKFKQYPVLDTSGKVAEWLSAGRGLRVWESQEIGANRPDQLTPGDVTEPPHWAYKGGDRLVDANDVVFFKKGRIYWDAKTGRTLEWSATLMGRRAAEKAIASLPQDNGNAPLALAFAYTIELVHYRTEEKTTGGDPIGLHDNWAIVQWTARRDRDESAS